jgi:hypothetical protein
LNPDQGELKTLKYNNFAGTMKFIPGLDTKPPLSVNDVQMADMFGIKGSDIGKNPALYEVMSRYANKVRDAQNALLPQGAQPWEAWQVQAPGWVHQRYLKDPTSEYDDYAMVFPKIIKELNDAGVPTPGGKITLDTFMDPRTPNVMSGTRSQFLKSPVATVETVTHRTAPGAAAAVTRANLQKLDPAIPWVRNALDDYDQIQRNAMRSLAMRKTRMEPEVDAAGVPTGGTKEVQDPSLISQLLSHVVGKPVDVSRLDWNGYGTFERNIAPNLRIPLTGRGSTGKWANLTTAQRKTFLSILGSDLNQDAMPASHFQTVPHGAGGTDETHSVFLNRYDNHVDQPAVSRFSEAMGFPVSVAQHPNGTVIDLNIGGMKTRPDLQKVYNLAHETFGNDPNVKNVKVFARKYKGDYVKRSQYEQNIPQTPEHQIDPGVQGEPGNTGGVGGIGAAGGDPGDLGRIRLALRGIADQQDAQFGTWSQTHDARYEQHLAAEAKRQAKQEADQARRQAMEQRRLAKQPPPVAPPQLQPQPPPGGARGGGVASILSRQPSRAAILRSLGG